MLPPGTYRAKAIDSALGRTSTGKEQIVVEFELADRAEGQPAEYISWWGYFTDLTFERTVQSLRHMGWKGNDLAEFAFGLPEGCDNEVSLVIEHEQDQEGNWRAKVRWINSGNGIAVKERLDEASAKAFGAKMKARVAALNGGSRPAASSKPATSAPRQAASAPRQASRPRAVQPPPPPEDLADEARPDSFMDKDIPF